MRIARNVIMTQYYINSLNLNTIFTYAVHQHLPVLIWSRGLPSIRTYNLPIYKISYIYMGFSKLRISILKRIICKDFFSLCQLYYIEWIYQSRSINISSLVPQQKRDNFWLIFSSYCYFCQTFLCYISCSKCIMYMSAVALQSGPLIGYCTVCIVTLPHLVGM